MHSGLPGLGLSLGKIQPLEGTVRTNPAAGRNIHLCVCACVSECVGLCVCVCLFWFAWRRVAYLHGLLYGRL